jgi:hypothetical protein
VDCVRADWSRGDAESLRARLGCLSLRGDMILFIKLVPCAGSSGGQQSETMGLKVQLQEDLFLTQQDVRAVMRCCCCKPRGIEFIRLRF